MVPGKKKKILKCPNQSPLESLAMPTRASIFLWLLRLISRVMNPQPAFMPFGS